MHLPVSRNCKNFMVYSFLLSLGRNEKGSERGGSGDCGGGEIREVSWWIKTGGISTIL